MVWTDIVTAIIAGIVTLTGYILVDKREKAKHFDSFKSEIMKKLEDHRKEYLEGIEDVKDSLSETKASYQQNSAIIELKIDSLEKKQDQHNNLIARMYAVETSLKLQENQINNACQKIDGLERKN